MMKHSTDFLYVIQREDLHPLSEGESEHQEQLPTRDANVVPEPPQSAHFLEAHVIFEPLLSAIGVITQQVSRFFIFLGHTRACSLIHHNMTC